MSLSRKGKPLSSARLEALKNTHQKRIGKTVTGKVKESLKLGPASLIGKNLSESTKQKIANSKIGKKFNHITRKYE